MKYFLKQKCKAILSHRKYDFNPKRESFFRFFPDRAKKLTFILSRKEKNPYLPCRAFRGKRAGVRYVFFRMNGLNKTPNDNKPLSAAAVQP
jgi:hypothetical protein